MSDKPRNRLNPVDREMRQAIPVGMTNGTEVYQTIERIVGFELFNTRRYHNYETWSDGWRITDRDGIKAEAEDLDVAVQRYTVKRKEFDERVKEG